MPKCPISCSKKHRKTLKPLLNHERKQLVWCEIVTTSQYCPVREFVEEILPPLYLQCGAANLCLQVDSSFSRWIPVCPVEVMFFVQSENIWSDVFSQGQMGFNSITPTLEMFMGMFSLKKVSEAKAPGRLHFLGHFRCRFLKKHHGKHPPYDVKVAFSDVDFAALFLKQRLKQHEVISKTIQFSSLKLIKSTRCLEKQRSLRQGQECQVWWELLVLQTGLGVEDVAFEAREVKDFYWKNMWYNMIIYLKIASTYLAKKKPKPSNYLLKWHHLCFRESEEKKCVKRSFKEFFSVFLSYSKKSRSRNQVVKASFRKLTFLQAFRWCSW